MADFTEFDHTHQDIYPLHNPLKKGYGVREPDVNPAANRANGFLLNQKNEKIEFWIEDLKANFGMTGSTAQSRSLRQFFPHNVTQPSITVLGKAPNSFQHNRLAAFVRASHANALGTGLRHEVVGHKVIPVTTVRLVVKHGGHGEFPYNGERQFKNGTPRPGQTVKGTHRPWAVEGYIKSMQAGARKENQAPPFEFEFFIADAVHNKNTPNLNISNDTQVALAGLDKERRAVRHSSR
jgi:hypothetical protein